jgi:Predicted dehydrogenases and related proteins
MDVGVIGVGAMGRNHARVYSELRDVDSLHVYDLNREATELMATQYQAIPAASLRELLGAVDAVSVCVPTRFSFSRPYRRYFAFRGLICLIEKPICASVAEGRKGSSP